MANSFDTLNKRITLSLGRLSEKKHCPYSCPFCYVHGGYNAYLPLSNNEICEFVHNTTVPFDAIYISGDTDSFAEPRTKTGLELLKVLTRFNVDLLFTTRHVFNKRHLDYLATISEIQRSNNKLLIGCTSIAQLNHKQLEPEPIKSPMARIGQLGEFKARGLISVAAICPIMPIVELDEYLKIIKLCGDKVDIVLASDWYTDQKGIIEKNTFGNTKYSLFETTNRRMDFNSNRNIWKVYYSRNIIEEMAKLCAEMNILFSQRSRPVLERLRAELEN